MRPSFGAAGIATALGIRSEIGKVVRGNELNKMIEIGRGYLPHNNWLKQKLVWSGRTSDDDRNTEQNRQSRRSKWTGPFNHPQTVPSPFD